MDYTICYILPFRKFWNATISGNVNHYMKRTNRGSLEFFRIALRRPELSSYHRSRPYDACSSYLKGARSDREDEDRVDKTAINQGRYYYSMGLNCQCKAKPCYYWHVQYCIGFFHGTIPDEPYHFLFNWMLVLVRRMCNADTKGASPFAHWGTFIGLSTVRFTTYTDPACLAWGP